MKKRILTLLFFTAQALSFEVVGVGLVLKINQAKMHHIGGKHATRVEFTLSYNLDGFCEITCRGEGVHQ